MFLSLAIWAVFVYSLFSALRGSPVLCLVKRTPRPVFEAAADLFDAADEDAEPPEDSDVATFLKRFFWHSSTALVVGLVEIALACYLVGQDDHNGLAWVVLVKQLISLPLEHRQRRLHRNQLRMLRAVPRWFVRWARLSDAVSAVCFLGLFVIINNLLPS